MIYTTHSGIEIAIGRIDRNEIDKFARCYPIPTAPKKRVAVWGGYDEVDDTDNPEYQRALLEYQLTLLHGQLKLLSPALNIQYDWHSNVSYTELVEIGVCEPDSLEDFLRFVALDEGDIAVIVDEIFYNSTTTSRAIDEAMNLFRVSWNDNDIMLYRTKQTPGQYGRLFEDREAARFALISWPDFCKLSGQEQSAIVAHFRLRNKLDYMMSQTK